MVHTAARMVAGAWAVVLAALASGQTPKPPADAHAAERRAEISELEALLPTFSDRGAVLCALARNLADSGDLAGALTRLKECVNLDEGFDPSISPRYRPLHGNPEFDALVERARKKFPPVAHARLAMTIVEKDLIPEGLAFDERLGIFYMGSINRCKIVKFARDGKASDLFSGGCDHLFAIVGVRVDASDSTVWAATS